MTGDPDNQGRPGYGGSPDSPRKEKGEDVKGREGSARQGNAREGKVGRAGEASGVAQPRETLVRFCGLRAERLQGNLDHKDWLYCSEGGRSL